MYLIVFFMEVIVWTTHRPHIQHKRSLIIYAMPSKELDEYQCQSFFNEDKKEERQYELYQVPTYKEIKIFVDFLKKRRGTDVTLS